MSDKVESPMAVIAIDFGTTYSGYAFSLQSQFQKDPTKVYAFTNWIPSTGGMISPKTPTSLLLKPNKEFYKFGYDAEDEYAELALDGEHHEYYFFRRFKMLLHRNPVMFFRCFIKKRKNILYHKLVAFPNLRFLVFVDPINGHQNSGCWWKRVACHGCFCTWYFIS